VIQCRVHQVVPNNVRLRTKVRYIYFRVSHQVGNIFHCATRFSSIALTRRQHLLFFPPYKLQNMASPQFHVAIVGAGLGGLAAAISIAQTGHKATILEQASELGEVRPFPPSSHFRMLNKRQGWSRNPNTTQLLANPSPIKRPQPHRIMLRPPSRFRPPLI